PPKSLRPDPSISPRRSTSNTWPRTPTAIAACRARALPAKFRLRYPPDPLRSIVDRDVGRFPRGQNSRRILVRAVQDSLKREENSPPEPRHCPYRAGEAASRKMNRQGVDHMKRIVLGLLAATAMVLPSFAADVQPALLYDLGGKFDKSFNEAAYNGAEKFKAETGTAYVEFEVSNASQREQALRRFAEDGRNPIVMAGFAWVDSLKKVAAEYPELNFAIIDDAVDLRNVRSLVFKEHEGSYLVGVLAGMASQTKKVGFIGGMDIPLIRKFGCGYVGGAKAAGVTEVLYNMTGDTPAAWNDTAKGGEIAKTQIGQSADVIYAA